MPRDRGGKRVLAGDPVDHANTLTYAIGKMFNVSNCLSIIFTRGGRRILDARFRFTPGARDRSYRIEHIRADIVYTRM